MTLHAVRITPSTPNVNRGIWLLVALAITLAASARAATLGVITDIDRRAGELSIDGQTYMIDSFSEVKQTTADGAEETAAWFSLDVGDYVIFDARNGRITGLRREAAESLDRPPGRPLDVDNLTPQER